MVFRAEGRRRPRLVGPVVGGLVVLVVLWTVFAGLYTDRLWFGEVGFTTVFDTVLRTRLLLFAVFGLLMAAAVGTNVVVAYRVRPPMRPDTLEQRNLDRYREVLAPLRRIGLALVMVVTGLIAGLAAAGRWQTFLLWRHRTPFGVTDPQFGRDVSYYAFTYPFQRLVVGFLFATVLISFVASVGVHYLFGGVRLQARERVIGAARGHLSVLLGLFVLLKAYAYYLDQFGLSFSPRGKVTGASYTDVHAQLPALRILVLIAVICGLLFVANIARRGWSLPATAFGLMLVSSFVIGGVYPFVIQQVRVKPNEIAREAPYIKRDIVATRDAYGLRTGSDVTYVPYPARPTASNAAIRADRDTLGNARLVDPNKVKDAFESLQQIRGYYGFPASLDVDRYDVGGNTETYVVAVRELDQQGLQPNQRSWINQHLTFTHGNGFVAAPTDVVDPQGSPVFAVHDIPPQGTIAVTEPRVYYGELAPSYSVVGTRQPEVDRPAASNGNEETTSYTGKGGVRIGGLWRKLLYATKFRTRYLMLSGALKPTSRILYVRDPRDRVRKVAPYLELDQDPYPTVLDGRIVWVVDGFTTSNGYPYSAREDLNRLTADSTGARQAPRTINYIRNSVKATVDAYDGTVRLYAWDEQDPILRTWRKVFPGTVLPRAAMPPGLLAHIRYPEDLFKIQRTLLASYHIDDPASFFREADFWDVPGDPSIRQVKQADGTLKPRVLPPQPPYYQYLRLPGDSAASFWLTSPLTARSRPNLAAFVSVGNDVGNYGRIQVLQLPTNTVVPGPVQRGSTFQTTPEASSQLTLLGQQGSEVVLGNLLTLPVGGTLVYVQPVYVQSSQGSKIPQLKRIFVGYGDRVGFAATYREALDEAFGVTAGSTEPPSPVVGTGASEIRRLSLDAQQALQAAAEAYGRQDYAEYARQQERLRRDLAALTRLTTPTASASPRP